MGWFPGSGEIEAEDHFLIEREGLIEELEPSLRPSVLWPTDGDIYSSHHDTHYYNPAYICK